MILPDHIRGRVYAAITYIVPILATYGILEEQQVALWVGLAGAILGTGLAAANTPRARASAPLREPTDIAARIHDVLATLPTVPRTIIVPAPGGGQLRLTVDPEPTDERPG